MSEQDYELYLKCEARWNSFAYWIFEQCPNFIKGIFQSFTENPLCISITSVLLAVAGFAVIRKIILAVQSRGV